MVSSYSETVQGSSPRMRGAPQAFQLLINAGGIIPAYAGSTLRLRDMADDMADHPRVCGEHSLDMNVKEICDGIIPAYAGSTARKWTRHPPA